MSNFARVCIARGVFTLRYDVRALHMHTSSKSSPVLNDSLSDLEYTENEIKHLYNCTLQDFLSSSGSGTGSTQPREVN